MKRSFLLLGAYLGCFVFSACDHKTKTVIFDGVSLIESGLYKIVPVSEFDRSNQDNCVKFSSLDQGSGFIHASYGAQVHGIIKKYFEVATSLILLELDPDVLKKNGTILCVEENKHGGPMYPHLYGTQKIPMAAVKKIIKIERGPNTQWRNVAN